MSKIALFDIGGTKTQAVIIDAPDDMVDLASQVMNDLAENPKAIPTYRQWKTPKTRAWVVKKIIAYLKEHAADDLPDPDNGNLATDLKIVIATTGVVQPGTGKILDAGDAISGWRYFELADYFEEKIGIRPVVLNDVEAFLLGHVKLFDSKLRVLFGDDYLGIMLGTGIGGSVYVNGEIYTGPTGAAMEIGHIPGFGDRMCSCFKTGHLESVASGPAILDIFHYRSMFIYEDDITSAAEVAELAREGNEDAAETFAEAGEALAKAVLIATSLFDVRFVVLGGGVINAWDLMEPAYNAVIKQENWALDRIKTLPLRNSASTVLVGALAKAATIVDNRPPFGEEDNAGGRGRRKKSR